MYYEYSYIGSRELVVCFFSGQIFVVEEQRTGHREPAIQLIHLGFFCGVASASFLPTTVVVVVVGTNNFIVISK